MEHYICVTCGTQYSASEEPPARCHICLDERQYVGHNGQQWTTIAALASDHHNEFDEIEPGLTGIYTRPQFAIGQRAILVQSPEGNTLWDCISLLNAETLAHVTKLGGIKQIAISHPHFYSSMAEWSKTFEAPIFIHADDRKHVSRLDAEIQFWEGETLSLGAGQTLIRCGGHFDGSQVLHVAYTGDGKGALLTADTMRVVADRRYVTFMYSYPNEIPLSPAKVRRIVQAVSGFEFDRIHGAWPGADVTENARAAVNLSAARYIAHSTEEDE